MATEPCVGDGIPQGSDVIEVHLDDMNRMFNSIDPSPFHEKDLDRDAEAFIVSRARELPADRPLALLVQLDKPTVTAAICDVLRDAVRTFFNNRSTQARRRLGQLLRTGRTSLAIGLLFLAACLVGGDWLVRLFPASHVVKIIRESLVIGGWVAMWRPLEIFLYDWWPILSERRLYERLSRMAVRVCVHGQASGGQAAAAH
jgi:hypothetical protein